MLSAVLCVTSTLMLSSPARSDTPSYCYAEDNNPFLDFGTKTAYEHVYNQAGIRPLEGCKAVQLWLLSRHGTRYPRAKNIAPMAELARTRDLIMLNYKTKGTALCKKDIDNLADWQFTVTTREANLLTTQGEYDLYNLARRLASYFPELLRTSYSPQKFVFLHTGAVRTKQSAEYFAKGLFGLNFDEPLPYSPDDDRFLHNYKYCPAREEDTLWSQEVKRWETSSEMRAVLSNVSRRLGFTEDLALNNVSVMYDMCRYQKAWQITAVSPWCAVFSDLDLKVMEYRDDLQDYYGSGPGNDYTMRLACPLVQDMVHHFTMRETNPQATDPRVRFYFSHNTLISMVISRLGLEPESLPPTADNYHEQKYRQFRTSQFVPFAANLLVVLYNCSEGRLQSVIYHAESPVQLTGCRQTVCDWKYLKKWLGLFVNDQSCTDTSFCFNMAYSHISLTLTHRFLLSFLPLAILIY